MSKDPKQEIASVYFVDGCVIEHDYAYVASKADALDPMEYDFSRMFFNDRGDWVYHDLEWDVKSVCVQRTTQRRQCVALSMQGDVEYQFVGGSQIEKIPGAGTFDGAGAMTQIREIGDILVACGYEGQVYWRAPSGWQSLGGGLAHFATPGRSVDLNSVDGTGPDDIYAVGLHGRIFHFDGKAWSEMDSPTNVHLERVRVVAGGHILVCGNLGTVLQGDRRGLAIAPIDGFIEHLWGIELYKGKVYAAHMGGLMVFDGRGWSPVDMGLDKRLRLPDDGYRLDAFDGVLWSFGPKRIAVFDGQAWTAMPHPDN